MYNARIEKGASMRETSTVEFKSDTSNTFLKTVSAYANFHDGDIFFGVTDDGTVVGLDDPVRTCADIENKINDSISPRPRYALSVDRPRKTVKLHVWCGGDKPYLYRGKAYRRSDSSTVEVDRTELRRLVLEGENLTFDQLASPDQALTFGRLSERLAGILGVEAASDDVLKTLGLLRNGEFTRAAAILADANQYPGIDIARFGGSISEMLDRITVEGASVLDQFDAAMERFEIHCRYEKVEGRSRSVIDRVPYSAYRETVANALVHRTWDVNARVRVSIFPDRIEVSSPGGLPPGISEEEYLSGRVSVLRNPLLAEVFFRLGYIEKFGTGVIRIRESYRGEAEEPMFAVGENSVTVVLPVLGSLSGAGPDETALLQAMSAGRLYTRSELETESGFGKAKTIRLLNSLLDRGLVVSEGASRSRRYMRA